MANPFVHVELNTPDPEKAKAFYSKLFQWQLEDVSNPETPGGTYTMVKVEKGTGGGIMKQVPGGPAGWLAYVEVDDISRCYQEGGIARREGHERCDRSDGHGMVQFHPRPHWRDPGAVANQTSMTCRTCLG